MPPIFIHLGIAREAASQLGHPIVEQSLGSYLLGATAPDIRFTIGATREETHFIHLDSEEGESGVTHLFEAHPELSLTADMNVATQSFIAGYLSHLVTDEAWIDEIYRPFFGRESLFGNDPMANLLDRGLQFELDRREQSCIDDMEGIGAELSCADCGVVLNFIDTLDLKRWREFIITAVSRDITWERFRTFARRYLVSVQNVRIDDVPPLLASLEGRLKQVLEAVPKERVRAFRDHSITTSVAIAREYLG
ncbi:zinc dependent phospholipase C family protein [Chloroflexota bacterium]